jgi:hypothetical protein
MSSPEKIVPANPKWMTWLGWGLTGLVSAALTFSAVMKFVKPPDVAKEFVRLGYGENMALGIGILEVACTVLYVIPQTSILGAVLLTGYLGGAVATHVRIGDPFLPPIIMGVLLWLGIFLREPRLRAIVPFRSPGSVVK